MDTVLQLLSNGADVSQADLRGNRPIHEACWCGHLEVVRDLLRRGCRIDSRGYLGRSPLHAACRSPYDVTHVVRALIAMGADVNRLDAAEKTPLFRCCEALEEFGASSAADSFLANARLLLEAGARTDLLDIHRETALAHTTRAEMHHLFKEFEQSA